jgi:hypothetical protein
MGSPPRFALDLVSEVVARAPRTTVFPPAAAGAIIVSRCDPSLGFLHSVDSRLAFRRSVHLPRFVPSSRHHARASTLREDLQSSLRSVLRFSQPLDGFRRTHAGGLVSSRSPRPGFRPFRGFSPQTTTLPRREKPAPLPFTLRRSPAFAVVHFEVARLQGLHPSAGAFRRSGYSPRRRSLPSSGFAPPGPPLSPEVRTYSEPSAHDLHDEHLRLRDRLRPRSSTSLRESSDRFVSDSIHLRELSSLPSNFDTLPRISFRR